jgi:hypothetical protein
MYTATPTIAASANLDLDLSGVLTNAFGQVLAFAKLTTIFIINAPILGGVNTTNLTIGAGTNPVVGYLGGTAPTIGPLRPGDVLLRHSNDVAGLCNVTAATADILRIANSAGAAASIQVMILGRSA